MNYLKKFENNNMKYLKLYEDNLTYALFLKLMKHLYKFCSYFYDDIEMKGNTIYNGKYIILELYYSALPFVRFGSNSDDLHFMIKQLKQKFKNSKKVTIIPEVGLSFDQDDAEDFINGLKEIEKLEKVKIYKDTKKFGL